MKKHAFAICLCTAAVLAAEPAKTVRRRPDAGTKPSGGIVEKEYGGKVFRVLDAQRALPHEKVEFMVREMRWDTLLPFETAVGEVGATPKELAAAAGAMLGEPRVGAGAIIVDDPKLPFRIHTEEGNWAVLNIAFLKEDDPDAKTLETRFLKMLWRVVARALQVGSVTHSPSVLQPFGTLVDLDANRATKPSPEGFNGLIDNSRPYGITTITIASYRDACRKGWAPPPKTNVQRVIWEEFKTSATNAPSATPPAK